MGKLIVANDILQTVCLASDNGHPSVHRHVAQIVALHLHTDRANVVDRHHPFDGLETNATDTHLCLGCAAWNHEVACLVAYTSTDVDRIGRGIEGDVGVGNRLTVWSDEASHQFRTVFLNALYEDISPTDSHFDGVESADLTDSLWQGASPLDGLGHSEVLQFVIDKGDVVAFRRLVEFDECLRERGALKDMLGMSRSTESIYKDKV